MCLGPSKAEMPEHPAAHHRATKEGALGNGRDQIVMRCDRLTRLVCRVFEAAGCPAAEALLIAQHLVDADLCGHDSHGLMRVSRYLDLMRQERVFPGRSAVRVIDNGPLAVFDGQLGFGQAIAAQAMEIVADKAEEHGVAVVGLRNSGHLGRLGAWAENLAGRGLISVHFANSSGFSILVAPHGGSDRRLSSNPIAAGIPRSGMDPIIVDMATSTVSEGKVQVALNRGERLPPGAIVDGDGKASVDPSAFYSARPGALLPFAEHKGFGLSLLCEVLAGSLTGGWASNPQSPTAGHLVNNMLSIAIDPRSMIGETFFADDVKRLSQWVRASPPLDPSSPVMLPGERSAHLRSKRQSEGIPLDATTWADFRTAAAQLGVQVDDAER
jgi:uncharacterized oxidoreductase